MGMRSDSPRVAAANEARRASLLNNSKRDSTDLNKLGLWPKTWYGMPAYAKDGNVILFFQSAKRFESRYATFGFNDGAKLDDGDLWPTAFALANLTPAGEEKIRELVKKAVR